MNFNRQTIKPPDKGSFPLDHFHDCNIDAKKYNKCLKKHNLMPKRCRKHQISYLECRMKNQLMEYSTPEELGMTQETSWESEQQEKRQTLDRIQKMKHKAFEKAVIRRRRELGERPTPGNEAGEA